MQCQKCGSDNTEKLGITIVELPGMEATPGERWKCNDCGEKMTVIDG